MPSPSRGVEARSVRILVALAFASGLLASLPKCTSPDPAPRPHSQPDADEVERMVVEQKRAGYDLIKTHGDFSREAFHRLFTAARREKIKVIGHAPRNLGTGPMFEEHMDAVAHAERKWPST